MTDRILKLYCFGILSFLKLTYEKDMGCFLCAVILDCRL